MRLRIEEHPKVIAALEQELDERELKQLHKGIAEIDLQMGICKQIQGLDEL